MLESHTLVKLHFAATTHHRLPASNFVGLYFLYILVSQSDTGLLIRIEISLEYNGV